MVPRNRRNKNAADQPVEPWSAHACTGRCSGTRSRTRRARAHPRDPGLIAELRLALVAISEVIPDWSLEQWNDHCARTHAGVIDTLARAQGRIAASAHREQP
jgi:hypothetical protein